MNKNRWIAGGIVALAVYGVVAAEAQKQPTITVSTGVDPATFQDPAVPLIALPTTFASRREKREVRLSDEGFAEVANIKGAGCVRHIWFLTVDNQDKLTLEITVDGAEEPQVVAPLKSFFGIMQDRDPYFVNCAAFTVLPNPVAREKDTLIPGTPGYNLFLPIPFSESCRVAVRGKKSAFLGTVLDWHQYDTDTPLTPYRLHATHKHFPTTPDRGTIEMANVSGSGFVAGYLTGYMQRNKKDMVFHTGGIKILVDEKTDPYTIEGNNVEDDYGFTWGFNDYQTRWIGCPTHDNRGRNDQDGVFYRFFGPDPIAFHSSMSFHAGCRGDDMETVVYYYKKSRN
ncbi:MAG: DUF2961 domain-containing protein [Planctomycetaceae bacterium]|nr:DUF2961 domain-containing protein [Planctomycetaceae bacterium]